MGREVLDHTAAHIRPRITTDELDRICHEAIIARDSYPSTLNYRGCPKSVCISVNEVICHGIPDQTVLQKGDIVNLDISLYHGGFHADLNATYPVGHIDEESKELIKATKQALDEAMAICKPGTLYSIDAHPLVQFHGKPLIAHYGGSKTPGKMEVGHCFTIEPMINAGGAASCDHWNDSWTAVAKDGSRSAQFEDMVL
ncbi:hypothetical protein QFC21_002543 [Naganishia friedmannii]|uniref:Uncharacterized protein n=1 Tax=Naganishia friedmannii TaxID=89922 RepID=A0ACC2VWX9_9TREE|nr:hypothetical protein QFC21_002543 [Naganishia friedmannii]